MKQTLLLLVVLLFTFTLVSQENYSRVRVYLDGQELSQLAALHLDVLEGTHKKGVFFETDFSQSEINRIMEAGFRTEILVADVKKFYRERAWTDVQSIEETDNEWSVPENWEYGTMGGYYTLDEAMAELDSMVVKYPDLISARQSLSDDTLTHENRKQWWVRLSDNPNTDEDEPEVLYTAIHHAREVIAVQQTIFYMWYLLENYDTDPEIKYIVDNTEMYIIPVLNPDGYQYNVTHDPSGGGMWRKNMRDNGDGTYGVDPNRNYGYMWGLDNEGSSPYTYDETYRGPAPFSEPENKNIRDFCNAHDFQIGLNYHSHGDLLLAPWGYSPDPSEDHELLMDYGQLMTMENNYTYGPGNTAIYPTNGGSDDWMYGEQTTKEKIFSYTPEIGNGGDGFWPSVARIIPLCKLQMWQNLSAARLVGKYGIAHDISPLITDNIDEYAVFEIKRMGLMDTETFTVSIEAISENIVEVGGAVDFNDMELLAIAMDSISFILDAGIEQGTEFSYLLSLSNGEITYSDTVTRIFGTEIDIFTDDGESMDNWSSAYWDTTTEDSYSPEHSITDSPGGNYTNNRTSFVELDTSIDLSGARMAFLHFAAKWEIEQGYDYVQVMAKKSGESSWSPLKGKYTVTGNNYQDNGKPVFDGFNDWVIEEINLEEYLEEVVDFRFYFRSDNYVTEDGFYFDDFTVSVISNITDIGTDNETKNNGYISEAYPNPARDQFRVQYQLEVNKGAYLELFDAVGNQILNVDISSTKGVANLRLEGLSSGVYYFRMVNGKEPTEMKKVIKL